MRYSRAVHTHSRTVSYKLRSPRSFFDVLIRFCLYNFLELVVFDGLYSWAFCCAFSHQSTHSWHCSFLLVSHPLSISWSTVYPFFIPSWPLLLVIWYNVILHLQILTHLRRWRLWRASYPGHKYWVWGIDLSYINYNLCDLHKLLAVSVIHSHGKVVALKA